jgi:hypothetical protein
MPLAKTPRDVRWHPAPPPEMAVEYTVLLTAVGKKELTVKTEPSSSTELLLHLPLASGENLLLFSNIVSVTAELREALRSAAAKLVERFGALTLNVGDRTMIFVDLSQRDKAIVETAWPMNSVSSHYSDRVTNSAN